MYWKSLLDLELLEIWPDDLTETTISCTKLDIRCDKY